MSVTVDNLSKEFRGKNRSRVQAVSDVSFQCEEGKVYGLLGLNGAGKTTILRIICTILRPQEGKVTVSGFDVAQQPQEVRKRIGFLPADSGLYNYFTPRETLRYFGKLSKYPPKVLEARINQLVTMFGMQEFADQLCKGFSSGMKQKVCLARAIVHDPPVVIFDEPTNRLDVITRVGVHDFIHRCRDAGKCVILSTHMMDEAEKLCDTIGILHDGKLLVQDTLDGLRRRSGSERLEDIFLSFVGAQTNGLE
jgi:sodium transport system ATP-binding protein